jgi:hypothetical protein
LQFLGIASRIRLDVSSRRNLQALMIVANPFFEILIALSWSVRSPSQKIQEASSRAGLSGVSLCDLDEDGPALDGPALDGPGALLYYLHHHLIQMNEGM